MSRSDRRRRARGEESLEDLELDLLLSAVARRYGYDFREYAPASLRRRVHAAMQAEGVKTMSGLQEILLHDPTALGRFISVLSVNVTAMFRDPPFFKAIRKKVVPLLQTYPFVRIWNAGCSTGEEAYSLAILLKEEGLADNVRIYATDMSADSLEVAQRGIYPLSVMKEYEANYIAAGGRGNFSELYRANASHAVLSESLKRNIVFSQHNLAVDGVFNEFNLVLCRNVMIYFGQGLRQRVEVLLDSSLSRFGFLALGMKESLRGGPLESEFVVVDERTRIYRRGS